MLSCAFPDSHSRMSPREDVVPNELSHRTSSRGRQTTEGNDLDALSETAAFARQSTVLDADLHWEMNYHEAAIFLEVAFEYIQQFLCTVSLSHAGQMWKNANFILIQHPTHCLVFLADNRCRIKNIKVI